MDSNLIYRPIVPSPVQKNNWKKVLIAIGAVVLVGLVFYYFTVPRKSGEGVSIPASELALTGVIVEKKSDSINIVSPNPPLPNQKPELYVIKITPKTSFLKIDKTQPDPAEEKITRGDLKSSQEVFVRYTIDESGNLNAQKIYLIISPPVSVSNTEKLKK